MGILGRKKTDKASIAACRHCGGTKCGCGTHPPRCRYCGRISDFGWSDLICASCSRARAKIEAGAMGQFPLASRRGLTGPPTIGDDALLVTLTRRLRESERDGLIEDRRDARRARRRAKAPETTRSTRMGLGHQDNLQRSSTSGAEATPEFAAAG